MASASYYGSSADRNSLDTPAATVHSPVVDTDKPLPPPHRSSFPPTHENSFPPTHGGGGGYTDDLAYAPNHYSRYSADTIYDPHAYGSNRPSDSPPTKHNSDPFSDDIPLHETGRKHQQPTTPLQQPPMSHVEQGGSQYPAAGRRRQKKSWKSRPWFVYFMTLVHTVVFCVELARNAALQGSPISTKPYFNPMIGPSTDVLINMGARFVPCMRLSPNFMNDDPSQLYPCPGRTNNLLNCTLGQWCGFNGMDIPSPMGGKGPADSTPDQWYRFIIPMFYHAGLIHLAFNMFMQVTLGGDMEREIGMIRFIIVYFCSGIFGFVLGGNLGAHGQPSVGASGSIFGIFSLVMLDLFYSWNDRASPGKDLIFLLLDIVIAFVLGLLPAIDNFSHIGGFVCGICLGTALMRSPNQLRKKIASDPPYTPATATNPYNTSSGDSELVGFRGFLKQPLGFFKGRKPFWWAWWLVRVGMLTLILVVFIVLINNFYMPDMRTCSWCKYLSCMPVNGWCDMYDDLNIRPANTTANPRMLMNRGLLEGLDEMF